MLALGCAGGPTGTPTPPPGPLPTSSPAPTPHPGGELSQAELRYLLLDQFGPISWCDPDFYPIQQQDEQQSADQHWPEITADAETFSDITAHLGLALDPDMEDVDRLAVYREWKLLNAVRLETIAGGYAFDLITETNPGLGQGVHSVGTIDARGTIELALQEQSGLTACPICLARGTLIATPNGDVPVETLKVGDDVWTLDENGQRVAQPLLRFGSAPVPDSHKVVHLVLGDGRQAWVSPGHPTADGRTLRELRAGDTLDGALVLSSELTAYDGGATFDVLPAGSTGVYWANGIMLGSTLR